MRRAIIILAWIVGTIHAYPQATGPKTLPPGFVDGSRNPASIPDYASYRLVLLSLAVPPSPTPVAVSRQNAKLARIGLSPNDIETLLPILITFQSSYSQWLAQSGVNPNKSADQQAQALVLATRDSILKSLTSDGASKFAQFVEREKAHMRVKP